MSNIAGDHERTIPKTLNVSSYGAPISTNQKPYVSSGQIGGSGSVGADPPESHGDPMGFVTGAAGAARHFSDPQDLEAFVQAMDEVIERWPGMSRDEHLKLGGQWFQWKEMERL